MSGPAAVIALLACAAVALSAVARLLDRRIPAAHLAAFVLLVCLPFPRAFTGGGTPLPLDHVPLSYPWLPLGKAVPYNAYLNDVVSQILPWTEAVRIAWKDGTLPLLDRWNGCGTPLAADSVSAAFSPFTLLTLPLPLATAFLLLGPLKLLIAMAGMWLWVRELRATGHAAFFAAVAFGLSLSFSQWLFFPQTAVFCLWPWMLFLLERGRDPDGRRRSVVALGVVLAIGALAGHPESMAVGVLFAAMWVALRWGTGDAPDGGAILRRFGIAGVASLGATAFLIVPSALAILASNRLVLALKPHWAPLLSPWPHGPIWPGVVTAFFPYALGDLIHSPVLERATGAVPEMDLGYFGIVGWAAAALVLRPGSRRARSEWVLIALLVCGLGVAVAQWPFAELFSLIPAIRNMFPLRFYSWVALAGPAIAALELDRFARDAAERPRAVAGAMVVPVLLGAAALAVHGHYRPEHLAGNGADFQRGELVVALGALGLTCGLLALGRVRPRVTVLGLAAVCAAQLLHLWHGLYPLYPVSLLYPDTPLIRFLHAPGGPVPGVRDRERDLPEQRRVRARRGRPHARSRRARGLRGVSRRDRRVPARRLLQGHPQCRRPGLRLPERAVRRLGAGRRAAGKPLEGRLRGVRRQRLRECLRPAARVRARACPPRRRAGRPARAAQGRERGVRSGLRRDRGQPRLAREGVDPLARGRRRARRQGRDLGLRRIDQRDLLSRARDAKDRPAFS